MSGMKTAYDSPEAAANRKLCENVNAELRRNAIMHWKTKYRIYADPSRATDENDNPTVWGTNITDVDTFLIKADGTKAPCFVVGGDNLHDPSVLCDMNTLLTVADDLEGGNARQVEPDGAKITVAHVLKNLGTYFKHLGVAEGTDMLGNFKTCTLRFQVHIVELDVGETLDDLEEGQLLITAQNYHSRAAMAKNVNLLFTAQGASLTTDASPPGIPVPLYLQGQSEDDHQLHDYSIGIEATKRAFSETGKQTMEEKAEQVARGRSAEVKFLDHEDMPEMCAVIHLQVPCKQAPMKPAVINPANLIAAAMMQSTEPPAPSQASVFVMDEDGVVEGIPVGPPAMIDSMEEYDMMEEEEADGVRYTSLCAHPVAAAPAAELEEEEDEEPAKYRSSGPSKAKPVADRYRGLSAPSPTRKVARLAREPPPKETCRAASTHKGKDIGLSPPTSTHKGKDIGLSPPLNQTNLAPEDTGTAGIPTATFSIFMVKPKDKKFGTDDVMNAISLAEKVRKLAGETHVRHSQAMKEVTPNLGLISSLNFI